MTLDKESFDKYVGATLCTKAYGSRLKISVIGESGDDDSVSIVFASDSESGGGQVICTVNWTHETIDIINGARFDLNTMPTLEYLVDMIDGEITSYAALLVPKQNEEVFYPIHHEEPIRHNMPRIRSAMKPKQIADAVSTDVDEVTLWKNIARALCKLDVDKMYTILVESSDTNLLKKIGQHVEFDKVAFDGGPDFVVFSSCDLRNVIADAVESAACVYSNLRRDGNCTGYRDECETLPILDITFTGNAVSMHLVIS